MREWSLSLFCIPFLYGNVHSVQYSIYEWTMFTLWVNNVQFMTEQYIFNEIKNIAINKVVIFTLAGWIWNSTWYTWYSSATAFVTAVITFSAFDNHFEFLTDIYSLCCVITGWRHNKYWCDSIFKCIFLLLSFSITQYITWALFSPHLCQQFFMLLWHSVCSGWT